MYKSSISKSRLLGFTLIEMAIVLVVIGFLLAALLVPFSAQRQLTYLSRTQTILGNAKTALLGFAQTKGRLPCPATGTSKGMEQPLGGGSCTQQIGFLPAATLGLSPTDSSGYLIDAWGNRIIYAVTQSDAGGAGTSDFTTAGDMATVGISSLSPNLRVCGSSVVTNCSSTVNLTNNAVAVIFSTGETGADSTGKADEQENLNAVSNVDTVFVSHDMVSTSDANEFDHLVIWISPYVLYNAMIEAGQLH